MKRYIFIVLLSVIFSVEVAGKFKLFEPVPSTYYDKRTEAILKPVRNCDYIVDFEFYGQEVKIVGVRKPVRRKLPSSLPKIKMKKILIDQKSHYDGYHEEEHYKYFLVQIPSGGYMQLNYIFTDRMGKMYIRKEKISKPIHHKRYPSSYVIPASCQSGGYMLR